jgi:hypothetical protein
MVRDSLPYGDTFRIAIEILKATVSGVLNLCA